MVTLTTLGTVRWRVGVVGKRVDVFSLLSKLPVDRG